MHSAFKSSKLVIACFLVASSVTAEQGANIGDSQAAIRNGHEGNKKIEPPSDTAAEITTKNSGEGVDKQEGVSTMSLIEQKAIAADMLSGAENLIPPQFESYLNSPEEETQDVVEYQKLFQQTVDLLRDKRTASQAVVNLYKLSEYPWDSGISRQLANRILSFWDMRNNQNELASANAKLQQTIRNSSRNADMLSDEVWRKEQERTRRDPSKAKDAKSHASGAQQDNSRAFLPTPEGAAVSVDRVMGKLQLTEEYFNSLDSRARLKLNEVQIAQLEAKAKSDFAAFVEILHQGKRHYHVRVAIEFYRVLFSDGDMPRELAAKSSQASELIRQIESDLDVFVYKVEQKKVASAAKMIREAFFSSQYHPRFQTVARSSKLLVAEYYEDLQRVQAMIEAKDFERLEKKLKQLEENVLDFDPTKPRALVAAVKRESQMRLGMARLAAQKGQLDKAMEEFKLAASAWPGNPDLEKASNEFFASQDRRNQGIMEFDKYIAERNYRTIFENQLQYVAAVQGDQKREADLKNALERVKLAELGHEKATLMQRNHDNFGAWETLELASADWPEDSKLNRSRAELSSQVPEFASAISKAKDAERQGNDGYALTWYLNAQRQYPPSVVANEAIARLSNRVLRKSSN
jgi:hypothetical protein